MSKHSSSAHALPPGLRLGEYEIVSPLTQGGMAAVYLGRRVGQTDGTYVAIKVVHPRFADEPAFVAMFLDEARLSARIHHPNVVRVLATGHESGLYYMVMEYLHGAPLQLFARRLAQKQRALKHEVIVHIVACIAEGLHAAHDATDEQGRPLGIVHRDVTPTNILVSYRSGVKLIDFGIAKAAGRVHQTAKGLLKGKLRYMAPEQAAGRAVDRRTDVYALGIVLWEMLTYRKAFSAKTDAELVRLVLSPKIPPPSRLNPAVTEPLDRVVLAALAPVPEERFQTALAFKNALYAAMPTAKLVDDAELSSLLRMVLADELAKEVHTLPASVAAPSVVVSAPRAVGTSEDALTQVVPTLAPEEEDEPRPSTPPPRERRPTPAPNKGATAFGIGLVAPTPMPQPPSVIVAPMHAPSFAPAAPPAMAAPPIAAPSMAAPPIAMPEIARTRMSPVPVVRSMAPAASFTPPNAVTRPVLAPQAADVPAPGTTSRMMRGCLIAIAVLMTIGVGTALGWFLLHHATRAMTP